MHPYGIDTEERRDTIVVLIVLSIYAGRLGRWLLGLAGWSWPDELSLLVDPTSAATFFFVFYTVVDRWLWRQELVGHRRLSAIPDLRGTWRGEMRSSFDEFAAPVPLTARIEQTWTKIVVRVTTAHSASSSETGSMMLEAGAGPTLSYTYLNRPKPAEDPQLAMHQGTCVLVVNDAGKQARLEGEYYSSRGRANYGRIWMERVPEGSAADSCLLRQRGPECVDS